MFQNSEEGPGRPCRHGRTVFSVVLSETRVNAGLDLLESNPPIGPGPISGQLALQPTTTT